MPPTPKDMGKEEKSREKEKSEKKKDKHKHKEQPPEEEVGHVTGCVYHVTGVVSCVARIGQSLVNDFVVEIFIAFTFINTSKLIYKIVRVKKSFRYWTSHEKV